MFFGLFHGLVFLPTVLMLIGSSNSEGRNKKQSRGNDAPSLPKPPPPSDDPSTGDTSVEASPNLGAVNGGFTQGEEVSEGTSGGRAGRQFRIESSKLRIFSASSASVDLCRQLH